MTPLKANNFILCFLGVTNLQSPGQAAENAVQYKLWTVACELSDDLKTSGQRAAALLSNSPAQVQKAVLLSMNLALFKQTRPGDDRKIEVSALEIATEQRLDAAISRLSTTSINLPAAIYSTLQLRGTLRNRSRF
ncbi:Trypanosome variant surface glycoprotein (A-type) [Trypanosoma brucei equiperdum]|uniref:Trypanosome variant surface glycoprotein (A-type) n=1 Tax=Trypanosoma brucei equiperdum TaxID=630700 RepID=A0A3L6L741_9TRYP|nr:Trypanosome variant surface glycoprotein (A-type) [Trypanosoma brucei equiperdum]